MLHIYTRKLVRYFRSAIFSAFPFSILSVSVLISVAGVTAVYVQYFSDIVHVEEEKIF